MEEPGRLQSMGLLESDTTERLHFHFSLSCIGEGNGNPLQDPCLENLMDIAEPGGLQSMGSQRVGHDNILWKYFFLILRVVFSFCSYFPLQCKTFYI